MVSGRLLLKGRPGTQLRVESQIQVASRAQLELEQCTFIFCSRPEEEDPEGPHPRQHIAKTQLALFALAGGSKLAARDCLVKTEVL